MGLAASQARLLTITARKADCEFESMRLSHQKIALSRDMERLSDEYQNAMSKTKLVYDYYGSNTSQMPLNYGLLMRPSVYNDYYPKLITDNTNRVVLSSDYAFAAKAAGIPAEGYNGTPSSEVRNKFVEALRDTGVITAATAASIESVAYNNGIGLGSTITASAGYEEVSFEEFMNLLKAKSVDTLDYGIQLSGHRGVSGDSSQLDNFKGTYPCEAYVYDMDAILDIITNPDDPYDRIHIEQSSNASVTLYDLLMSDNEYVYSEKAFWGASNPFSQIAYMQQLFVGNENSNSFLKWMVDQFSNILGGVAENDLALQYAYNQIFDLLYPNENLQEFAHDALNHNDYFTGRAKDRQDREGYEDDSDGWDGHINDITSQCATSVMGGFCEETYEDYKGGVFPKAPHYMGIIYSHCGDGGHSDQQHSTSVSLNNIAKAFLTAFMEYLNGIENSKYSYEMGQTDDGRDSTVKYNLYEPSDTDIFKVRTSADVSDGTEDLYAGFYDALFNRICVSGWTLNANIEDGQYMQQLLKNGAVFISSVDNDGCYYQSNYATDTYIAEVADTEGIALAEAKYNAAKAKIEHKENTIDMKMKNLDTEISALDKEYDTMKGVISKTIEKSFKRYEA